MIMQLDELEIKEEYLHISKPKIKELNVRKLRKIPLN
jgi:hypothetical protein